MSNRTDIMESNQSLVEALRACQRSIGQLRTALIVVEPNLDKPFPDDPRWSPWTRFIQHPWTAAATASELARAALKAIDDRPSVNASLRVNADMKVSPDPEPTRRSVSPAAFEAARGLLAADPSVAQVTVTYDNGSPVVYRRTDTTTGEIW